MNTGEPLACSTCSGVGLGLGLGLTVRLRFGLGLGLGFGFGFGLGSRLDHHAQERLGRLLGHLAAVVLVHDGVPVGRQDEQLGDHPSPATASPLPPAAAHTVTERQRLSRDTVRGGMRRGSK